MCTSDDKKTSGNLDVSSGGEAAGAGREAYPYRPLRVIAAYALVSLFIAVFGLIYEHFSHEVDSNYMRFAFLIPAAMGLPAALLFLIVKKAPRPGRYSSSVYRWSCAFLTGGALLRGVFEIYGTDSVFPRIYFIAGTVLLVASLVIYIKEAARARQEERKDRPAGI